MKVLWHRLVDLARGTHLAHAILHGAHVPRGPQRPPAHPRTGPAVPPPGRTPRGRT